MSVLLSAPERAAAAPRLDRVELTGDVVARDSLEREIAAWPRSADEAAREALARALVQRLATGGYVGARVSTSVGDGVLWVLVQVRRVGDLSLSSNLSAARRTQVRARFQAALCDGATPCAHPYVNLRALETTGRALAAELGVDVHAELSAAPTDPERMDVVVVARRTARGTVTAGVDNAGMASTGRYRFSASAQGRNLLLPGDAASVQAAYTGKGLTSAGASASVPLPWRGLRVGVSASRLTYALGGDYEALGYSGRVTEAGISVSAPLANGSRLALDAQAGASWKSTANAIAVLGASSATRDIVGAASVAGDWRWSERPDPVWGQGVSRFGLGVEGGRLRLLDARSQALDAISARTQGGYGKLTFSVQHAQDLPSGVELTARVRGALASRNLDPSVKFVLTGPDAARAFASGRVTADDAMLATLEARVGVPLMRQPLSLAVFLDAGGGRINHAPWPGYGGPAEVRLVDGGASLGFKLGAHLTGLITAASELGAPQLGDRRSALVSFSLNGSY